MGEKSGGLWLIVIVVVLAGLLIFMLAQFFPEAARALGIQLMDTLNEISVNLGLGDGGSDEPIVID